MKPRNIVPLAILDYVDTPGKVRKLTGLLPKANRGFAKALLLATASTRVSMADEFARYHHRLANSIVELEAKESEASQKSDPVKFFSIGTEAAVERIDRDLGHCSIRYHDFSLITSGWFAGGLSLKPKSGGVTFTFLDGLPEGATLYFYLNWSAGNHNGTLSPGSVGVPHGIVSGHSSGARVDFQWTITKPNQQVMVCMNDASEAGTVAFGSTCRISYY
jgi:hypothetical protein